MPSDEVLRSLRRGMVIPAHPLALDARRKLDERRQRAVTRYYLAAGVGGVAVGVHTTQFAIRDPAVGLLRPVLDLAADEVRRHRARTGRCVIQIAGICGRTEQAVKEAALARELGYDIGLLSLSALRNEPTESLVAHCRQVAEIVPIMGFYLQPAVGGRILTADFWRRFAEIENVVAIKIAPFNRYHTFDVVRGVAEAHRAGSIALYTGNDDNIIADLLTRYTVVCGGRPVTQRIVGGLLGHWAVWTRRAVEQLDALHAVIDAGEAVPAEWLQRGVQTTDANAAFFDAANGFAGCIAGLHEVLRRQGLFEGIWCLDPNETLSAGQAAEIDRVYRAYPDLNDDAFVREHLDEWLS
ncbi:MAG: dihydrodipicolinate synthase family protein [Planctomycetes bacterium]|nr:dihydrodipicolinate synthase family protein [Planctomycetota bacterium]